MSDHVILRFGEPSPQMGRAVILETLLPQLTGINLPRFLAEDLSAAEELIDALNLTWEKERKE